MNPLYKIVKGILDLCRQTKNIKVNPQTKIALEKYRRRINWIKIIPILTAGIGIFILISIFSVIINNVSKSANLQARMNTTGFNITESGGGITPIIGIFVMIIITATIFLIVRLQRY